MTYTPSPQQAACLDWITNGTGSAIWEAVAGAGKTSTVLEAIARTGGNCAILAYGKKIAEEIKAKLAARGIDWKTAQAGTVHSFGFSAYRKAFPGVVVDQDKVAGHVDAAIRALRGDTVEMFLPWAPGIVEMVGLAKQRAIGITTKLDNKAAWFDLIDHFDLFSEEPEGLPKGAPVPSMDRMVDVGISALQRNNADSTAVDYDDMVYLPVLHRVRFWKFQWVFVDEAQDTNPARRALVRSILAKGGRVVAVGDPAQAIFGFTGADSDSLDLIAQDFAAVRMPMTVSYRCPQKVVAFAQQWVDHIQAHEDAPEGTVSEIQYDDLFAAEDLIAGTAVLSRTTKPLIDLAFALIRKKVACRVEGRDIGNGLIKLATRWKRIKTINALEAKLTEWADKQIAYATAKKNEQKAQMIEDQVATIAVFAASVREAGGDSVADLVTAIQSVFADDVTDMLVLSTIHKSKGREWETVYWLDRKNTCPSRWARQAWQKQQEANLCYVAATRAKNTLIEIMKPKEEKQP